MAKRILSILLIVFLFSGGSAFAACPSADITGDCFVDFEDFAVIGAQWLNVYDLYDVKTLANQWLTGYPDMAYIPSGEFEMGDPCEEGSINERPVHSVLLDAFFMGTCETTNQQYCDYLNSAYPGQIKGVSGVVYASSDDPCDYPYCNTSTSDSQIDFNDVSGIFSVRTKGTLPRDMSDDPMVMVSWYGAAAYCNWRSSEEGYESCYNLSTWDCNFATHGYRLPTEAEWEYAARGGEHSPYYRFPWGDTISHSQANYKSTWSEDSPYYSYDVSPTEGYHPLWNGDNPDTSPVGFFDGTMKYKGDYNWHGSATSYQTASGANGYGLYDMAGNVWEWCNDWHETFYYDTSPYDNPTGPTSGTYRVFRSGGWFMPASQCRVSNRGDTYYGGSPDTRFFNRGFRIVLDLE